MIKSEVVKNGDEGIEANVTIEGTGEDLYTEIRAILESFDSNPEMALILVKAISKLIEKLEVELMKYTLFVMIVHVGQFTCHVLKR